MIVADIFGEQSLQDGVRRGDDVIQHHGGNSRPSAPRHRFAKAFERRALRLDLQRPNGCGNLDSVLASGSKLGTGQMIQMEKTLAVAARSQRLVGCLVK